MLLLRIIMHENIFVWYILKIIYIRLPSKKGTWKLLKNETDIEFYS